MNFLRDITLGQYLPGNSLLHRLDPRTKFLALLLLMVVTFWIRSFIALGFLWGFFLFSLILSALPWGFVFRGVRSFLWLFLFTAAVHFFFTEGPSLPPFPVGFVNVTWTGVEKGLFVATQLLLAILISSLLTLTTAPLRLAQGLEKMISPLKRFHVPVEDFSMMAMVAIKFIPILLEETNRIIRAQSARGVDFESGNIFRRAKNLVPVLTPLFYSIFKRADDLAIAMLARGFVSGKRRTHMHELRMTRRDYAALAAVIGFCILEMKVG
jgi:energy-coupling factor transport system permease protein